MITADLKRLRLEKGLTLEQVGNIVGVGKSTVRKWETGDIASFKSDKIEKLSSALGVDVNYLLGLTDGIQQAEEANRMRDIFTDEQVEQEIARLTECKEVKLARAEQRLKYRRRQYMYTLRSLERRGKELMHQGYTEDSFLPAEGEEND